MKGAPGNRSSRFGEQELPPSDLFERNDPTIVISFVDIHAQSISIVTNERDWTIILGSYPYEGTQANERALTIIRIEFIHSDMADELVPYDVFQEEARTTDLVATPAIAYRVSELEAF